MKTALKILWVVVSCLLLATLGLAQTAQSPTQDQQTEPQPKLVERYDVAHAKSVSADPHLAKAPDGTMHVVCEITVLHENGDVYKQFPYDSLVDVENDSEVIIGIANSYNACRDRLVEILTDYRDYHRKLKENTISAKKGR